MESRRDASVLTTLPPLTVAWLPKKSHPDQVIGGHQGGGAVVSVPVYVSLSRDHVVCQLYLQTDNVRNRILNSTALFLTEIQWCWQMRGDARTTQFSFFRACFDKCDIFTQRVIFEHRHPVVLLWQLAKFRSYLICFFFLVWCSFWFSRLSLAQCLFYFL